MSTAVRFILARTPLGRAAFGFLAGAIAVVVAHQVMVFILGQAGYIQAQPWSFRDNPYGVPQIINQMFWGGLWGILYAFIAGVFPGRWPTWMKGLAFGFGVHVVLGNWIVVALIRGQPLFSSWVPQRMLIGALIGTAFGLGVAYVYAALGGRGAR